MLIGSILFTIFSYIIAAAKSASDEAELVHYYRSPKGRSHELNAFFSKVAMRAVGIFGMIVWFVLFIQAINPALTKSFFVSATNLSDASSWLWLVLAILGMALSLYMFAVLARIIVLRPRVFGTSEEV
jgi:cytoskeletal protein RodZ